MKKMLKSIFSLFLLFNISFVFANTIDHFEVEFPKDQAVQYESLDITIKAVDKNGEIVNDYTGTILAISETDDSVELPDNLSSDDGYTFSLSDQGVKKFENGVKFSGLGEQSISIYDVDDYQNIIGKGEITIIPSNNNNTKLDIEIISPENNMVITKNSVTISGTTKKNHQVEIEVNGNEKISTTSNTNGIFEKQIENLKTGENYFKAYVLDSDGNIVGQSTIVTIEVNNNKPEFKKIILSPLSETGSVLEDTLVDVKVYASKKLKAVKLLFNDGVISLSETEDGIYTGSFKTPKGTKSYKINVVLSDNLGHITNKKDAAIIHVYQLETNSAGDEEGNTQEPEPITCSGANATLDELKIKGLKLVKLKNKSILTWDKVEKAESYDIFKKNDKGEFDFIKNIKQPKFEIDITGNEIKYNFFAVRAKASGCNPLDIISGDLSKATEIQTGPAEIILMMIIALILGFIIVIFRKRNA